MKILITESQLLKITEIATYEKQKYGAGVWHNVYETSDPNKLIKVGSKVAIDGWYDIFVEHPDLFPKVYKKGIVKVKLRNDELYDAYYVIVEKLDTKNFKILWEKFDNAIQKYKHSLGDFDDAGIQYYMTALDPDDLSFVANVAKTMENDVLLHNRFIELINLLLTIYEIKPAADIHKDQFGIDKQGKIKCLDI